MKESDFQKEILEEIKHRLPGSIVIKNDSMSVQGFPDLTIFYKDKYALLEVKKSEKANHQPNQDYYIDKFGKDTFASFIYPENKEVVLDELEQSFKGCTRR